jgi:DNA ligase (NAD+)
MDPLCALQRDFFPVLSSLSQSQLEEVVRVIDQAYYNDGQSLLTDEQYDRIKERLSQFPSELVHQIGAEVVGKKVALPHMLGSMNKIKPDSATLSHWTTKYPGKVCVSDKLDGISALLIQRDGKRTLLTRGNGTHGQDISHLLPHIQCGSLDMANYMVRGELILSHDSYQALHGQKGARSLVAGLANQKTLDAERIHAMTYIEFVAYEIIEPMGLLPSQQFSLLDQSSFMTVRWTTGKELTVDYLVAQFTRQHASSPYDMDGLVIMHDKVYPRPKDRCPAHAFAFKMTRADQQAVSTVLHVHWEASKDGFLKPTIQIEPVQIGSVVIQYTTGFNARFIQTNRIGPGAVIELIRSGDVIPHIQHIHQPSPSGPSMPTESWHWNDTEVDALLDDLNHSSVQQRALLYFVTTMGIGFCGAPTIDKLYHMGVKTIDQLIALTKPMLLEAGWGDVSAHKLITEIQTALPKATQTQWAVGSGMFGRGMGVKRLEPALALVPVNGIIPPTLTDEIASLSGWSYDSAQQFTDRLPEFLEWIKSIKVHPAPSDKVLIQPTGSKLQGHVILCTGYHPKDVEELVQKQGGSLVDRLTKHVTMVVVKDESVSNEKTKKAQSQGIPIYPDKVFRERFL